MPSNEINDGDDGRARESIFLKTFTDQLQRLSSGSMEEAAGHVGGSDTTKRNAEKELESSIGPPLHSSCF